MAVNGKDRYILYNRIMAMAIVSIMCSPSNALGIGNCYWIQENKSENEFTVAVMLVKTELIHSIRFEFIKIFYCFIYFLCFAYLT